MELLVIELKTALKTCLSSRTFFSSSSWQICHAIASPSLSGSVARINLSAFLINERISSTCCFPLLFNDHFILVQSPGITAPSFSSMSLTCPKEAITL